MRKKRLILLWGLCVLVLVGLGATLSLASPFSLAATRTGQTQSVAAAAGTRQGADPTQVQIAIDPNHANWPQRNSNWCGIATVAAIAQFRGHAISQPDVAAYLNSAPAVSPWGTPSWNGIGPGFQADIARDFGTDPRSLAVGIAAEGQGSYHQYVGLASAFDATAALAADIVRTHEPISVITQHGLHSVLVSAVWATGDPVANPSSITALDVWDPGFNANNQIQSAQYMQVPISTWLTNSNYWGSPYAANGSSSAPFDPDPAVGPYTFTTTHLWIGHYVYIRPDAASDPATGVSADWPVTQAGALIPGFSGELPVGYSGPTVAIIPGSEASKITLGDTSIAAPGFWSEATNAPAPASYTPVSAIAWAGTDVAHHVNVMLSADGLHYDHKITLGETTFTTPSVLVVNRNNANVVVVAWGGTDGAHSLNILYDVYGSPLKRTFWGESSPYALGLSAFNGKIYLTWAGSDPGHSLNVLDTGPQGQIVGAKTILWQYHSTTPPTLTPDSAAGLLILTWRNGSGSAPRIGVAQSSDGANWTDISGSGGYVTIAPPALIGLNPVPVGMTRYYQLWAGTDPAQRFLLSGGAAPNAATTMTALGESSIGGPQLGAVGQPHQVLIVWTGTDIAHHLNISAVSV
jgi:hypothetical protein